MCLVPLDPEEKISRYIFDRGKIRWSVPNVKHTAFMPTDGCLSVFRVFDLTENMIWEKGDELGVSRGRPLLGRADVKAATIVENELVISPDDDPPRHANIIGWPVNDSAIKLKALILADNATLCLKN